MSRGDDAPGDLAPVGDEDPHGGAHIRYTMPGPGAGRRPARCQRQTQAEDVAGVGGRDQPVVPQAGGRVVRVGLGLVLSADLGAQRCDLVVGGVVGVHAGEADVDQHGLGGVGRHGRDPAVGPREEEPRREPAPAHAVVAGAVGTADQHRVLRDGGVGDGGHHLRAVLGDARGLAVAADHVAAGVLEEQQRHPSLLAELDEVRGLQRRLGEDDAVVGDDADQVPPDAGEPADDGGRPTRA
jgi:hypothetical protein